MKERLTQLGSRLPGPMGGFARLRRRAVGDGAFSAKLKELMTLAVGIAIGCDGCIAYHTHTGRRAPRLDRLMSRARSYWKRSVWRSSWEADQLL